MDLKVEAGAALALRNQSAGEVHELVAMRLADDDDQTAVEVVSLPEQDPGALFNGPPALVLVAPSREDGFAAVGDCTLAEPGRYLSRAHPDRGPSPPPTSTRSKRVLVSRSGPR